MKKINLTLVAGMSLLLCACGGKGNAESGETAGTTLEARTVKLEPMSTGAIVGDDEYNFNIQGMEDGKTTAYITLEGTPDTGESGSTPKGTIRAKVDIEMWSLKDKVQGFRTSPTLPLYIYNADKEGPIANCRLEMTQPDSEALKDIVKRGEWDGLTVTYRGEFTADEYNKIFDTAKYFQFQGASFR